MPGMPSKIMDSQQNGNHIFSPKLTLCPRPLPRGWAEGRSGVAAFSKERWERSRDQTAELRQIGHVFLWALFFIHIIQHDVQPKW